MSKKQKLSDKLKILEEEFDNSSSDGESSVTSAVGQMVDVHFEGFTAADDDADGIKRLLSQTFRGGEVNLSQVANAIISQNYVGSVIKEVIDDEREAMEIDEELDGKPDEEGDYVFGLNTILNLSKKKDESFIKAIRSHLEKYCCKSTASEEMKSYFKQLLVQDEEHVGLLINERLVNLPCEVALPAFSSLQEEVNQALEIQLPYDFKHVVMICKVYKIKTLKNRRKQKKSTGNATDSSCNGSSAFKMKEVFANTEEEVFGQFSVCNFEYSVDDCESLDFESWNDKEASQKHVGEFRRVIVIPADKMVEAVQKAITDLTAK